MREIGQNPAIIYGFMEKYSDCRNSQEEAGEYRSQGWPPKRSPGRKICPFLQSQRRLGSDHSTAGDLAIVDQGAAVFARSAAWAAAAVNTLASTDGSNTNTGLK